jgi:hypothetical protein
MVMNINVEPYETASESTPSIEYDVAVKEGQTIAKRHGKDQWRLGELGALIEPKYAKKTLATLAEEIGINFNTLKGYVATYRAYPDEAKVGRPTFAVAQALAAVPDRETIIVAQPDMTVREARKIAQAYKDRTPHEAWVAIDAGKTSHRSSRSLHRFVLITRRLG